MEETQNTKNTLKTPEGKFLESPRTTTGRHKFWMEKPLSKTPWWVPGEPILKTEKPARKTERKPDPRAKPERNRKICERRAQGASTRQIGREYGIDCTMVRRILDRHMTPEEVAADEEWTRVTLNRPSEEEAQWAVELRRQGVRFREIARIMGRSRSTVSRLLKRGLKPGEMETLAARGRGHHLGQYTAQNPDKRLLQRRALNQQYREGRTKDPRPLQRVQETREIPCLSNRGQVFLITLECGHNLRVFGSKAGKTRMRCQECGRS